MEGQASLTGLRCSTQIWYQALGGERSLTFGFDVAKGVNLGAELMKAMTKKIKEVLKNLFKEWTEAQRVKRGIFEEKMGKLSDRLAESRRKAREAMQNARKQARTKARAAMKSLFRGRGRRALSTGYGYGSLEDLLAELRTLAANASGNMSLNGTNMSAFLSQFSQGYGDNIDANASAAEQALMAEIYGADYNSSAPTSFPTGSPTTKSPTGVPTTATPTIAPTTIPTASPTNYPTTKTQKYSRELSNTLTDTLVVWAPIMWVVLGFTLAMLWVYFHRVFGCICGVQVIVEVVATGKSVK